MSRLEEGGYGYAGERTMGGRWEEGALHWRRYAHGQVGAGLEADGYDGHGYDEHGEYGMGVSGRQPVAGGSRGRGALDRCARGCESPATTRYSDESIVESMAKATLSTEDTKHSEDEVATEKEVKGKLLETRRSREVVPIPGVVCLSDSGTVERVAIVTPVPERSGVRELLPQPSAVPTVDRSKPMRVLRTEVGRMWIESVPIPKLPSGADANEWVLVRLDYAILRRLNVTEAIAKGSFLSTDTLGTVVSSLATKGHGKLGKRVSLESYNDRSGVGQFVAVKRQRLKVPKNEVYMFWEKCKPLFKSAICVTQRLQIGKKTLRTLEARDKVFLIFGSNALAVLSVGVLSVRFKEDAKIVVVVNKGESEEVKARFHKFGADVLVEWESVSALGAELAKLSDDGRVRNLIDFSGDTDRVFECMCLVRSEGHVVLSTVQKPGEYNVVPLKWVPKTSKKDSQESVKGFPPPHFAARHSQRKDVELHYGSSLLKTRFGHYAPKRKRFLADLWKERGVVLAEAIGAVVTLSQFPAYDLKKCPEEIVIDMWK